MNKHFLIYILFLLLISQCIIAQNKYDFDQFWDETKTFVKQPGNWDKNHWLTAAAITGGTIGLMFLDESVRDLSRSNIKYEKSIPAEFGRIWGEPYLTGIIGGSFLLHGILADNTPNQKVGFEVFQSFVYTTLTVGILKVGLGRARPYTENNAFTFNPFYLGSNDYWSLPSGHTSTAFSLSTVLAANVNSDLMKVLCFIPAVMTGVSRVYQNHHWTSDVFLGAAIGYFVGKFVTDMHKSKEGKHLQPSELINFSLSL